MSAYLSCVCLKRLDPLISKRDRNHNTLHTAYTVHKLDTAHTAHAAPTAHIAHTAHTGHYSSYSSYEHHLSSNLFRVRPKRLHLLHALWAQVISRVLADEESVPPHCGGGAVADDAVRGGWGPLGHAGVGRHAEAAYQRPVSVSRRLEPWVGDELRRGGATKQPRSDNRQYP